MKSLRQIRGQLQKHLANETMYTLVNTRLLLRTGVDLRNPSEVEDLDQETVGNVLDALKKLGYQLE